MKRCRLKQNDRVALLLSACSGAEAPHPEAAMHFLECTSCADDFAQQSALWNRLDSWTVPDVSLRFNRELYAKIDNANSERWYDRWARSMKSAFAQPSLAIAAATLVLVAGFVIDHSGADRRLQQSAQAGGPKVSTAEAEQVEKTLDDLEMLRQFDLAVEEKETTSKSM